MFPSVEAVQRSELLSLIQLLKRVTPCLITQAILLLFDALKGTRVDLLAKQEHNLKKV